MTLDVGAAARRALEATRGALFRPLRVATWLKLGVIFFFASFVDPAFGGGGFSRPRAPRAPHGAFPWPHPPEAAWLVFAAAFAFVALAVFGLALAWVGCRASMMAYRAVARRDADEALGAFREVGRPADALFRSYAVVWLASAALLVPLATFAAWTALGLHASGASDETVLRALVPHAVVASAVLGAGMVASFFVRAFVAPILFHLGCTAREAWRRTFALVRTSFGDVAVFVLARVALAFVVGVASTIVTFGTCCVGGLPIVHQTLLAPLLWFERAFTLEVITPDVAATLR